MLLCRLMKLLIALVSLAVLSGCATITTGTTQSVSLETGDVKGATCEGVDSKGRKYYWKETPCSADVRKGDGPLTITCTKDGHDAAMAVIDENLVNMTFGNILLGGVIGAGVDAMSGAAQEYPTNISVPMKSVTAARSISADPQPEMPSEPTASGNPDGPVQTVKREAKIDALE